MPGRFSTIDEAVETLAAGGIVIVLDAEDRENEGDLLAAAELVSPHTIHFMLTEARGQLCVPVDWATAERLELRPIVETPDLATPRFAVPIDDRRCTTGVSPLERAMTIRHLANPASRPQEFLRPGHIFPLIARPGGLRERLGHTEAAVEITRLAGLKPAGVLCEVCSRDGLDMARRDELFELAAQHRLPVVTIDALVEACCGPHHFGATTLAAVER